MASTAATSEPATATPTAEPHRGNQREHILDAALRLMSEQGAGATSMRQLAAECGLNVAALYHYFPSKADLLRSVIEERQYALRLRELPEVDPALPPRERLTALLLAMWEGAAQEEEIWRLLLGEGLRGDETALAVGRELLETIEPALHAWLETLFADTSLDCDAMTSLIMSQLFSYFVTHLFRSADERDTYSRAQAEAIAALAFPS